MADSIERWENEGGAVAPAPKKGAPTGTGSLQSRPASASNGATVLRAAPAARPASSSS
jgi:hypothetical protein